MGLSEDQIGFESIKGERRLGKSLVNYAQPHGYDTIVIGRTGIDRAFFMGSVSRQVINRFSEAALWVVN
ncbi:MAG: universal stress protein [Desulfobacter sp.]|nr:universal stress protein [Desulfobacter sp.]